MRSLKSFKLFENTEEDKNEILSNCEDFMELDVSGEFVSRN
jgi:hypothetical protein